MPVPSRGRAQVRRAQEDEAVEPPDPCVPRAASVDGAATKPPMLWVSSGPRAQRDGPSVDELL